MTDIAAVLAAAKPKTTSAKVCVRGDLLGLHEQLEEDLALAVREDQTENRHAQAPGLAKRIGDLEEEIAAAVTEFHFQAIGDLAWSDLLAEHMATPEEQSSSGRVYDRRTFPYAAVAASCVDPEMTAEQAKELAATINEGQWALLWDACLRANAEGRDPFSLTAFAVRASTKTKRASRTTTGSPAASS